MRATHRALATHTQMPLGKQYNLVVTNSLAGYVHSYNTVLNFVKLDVRDSDLSLSPILRQLFPRTEMRRRAS